MITQVDAQIEPGQPVFVDLPNKQLSQCQALLWVPDSAQQEEFTRASRIPDCRSRPTRSCLPVHGARNVDVVVWAHYRVIPQAPQSTPGARTRACGGKTGCPGA